MQRYNIAFLPTDVELAANMVSLAQQYFNDLHNGYVLGDGALPHITLCQFRAPNDAMAISAYRNFSDKDIITADIYKFHVREGKRINAGSFIAEYKVVAADNLIKLQQLCHDHLLSLGLEVLTPAADYSPHFTLARLAASTERMPSLSDLQYTDQIELRPAVGLSTDPGAFIREIAD